MSGGASRGKVPGAHRSHVRMLGAVRSIGSVKPGLHELGAEGPAVVWWDPAVLALEGEERAPIHHHRIIEGNAQPAAAESEARYAAWSDTRAALVASA